MRALIKLSLLLCLHAILSEMSRASTACESVFAGAVQFENTTAAQILSRLVNGFYAPFTLGYVSQNGGVREIVVRVDGRGFYIPVPANRKKRWRWVERFLSDPDCLRVQFENFEEFLQIRLSARYTPRLPQSASADTVALVEMGFKLFDQKRIEEFVFNYEEYDQKDGETSFIFQKL